ncbi:MAG: GntR family transcriptional regulator [Burkholderiales bacterium]|nr:GntR family transcriptional regulator [Burkholderiales bacterium]
MSADQDNSQRRPRYLALAEEISRAVAEGAYAVGTLLPSEAELCDRHRVSRHTVRESLRVLQEMGLVARHQGLGTRITAATAPARYVLAMDAIPDLWEYVKNTELKVVRSKLVKARDALTPLPGDQIASWRLLEAVRYMKSGEPIAWKQVYIDARYDVVSGAIGKRTVPIYSLIEQRYGVKTQKVRQEISAIAIPPDAARALAVKRGSSGLAILRHYVSTDERVFEVTMSLYPANRFRYSVELNLERGNGRSLAS